MLLRRMYAVLIWTSDNLHARYSHIGPIFHKTHIFEHSDTKMAFFRHTNQEKFNFIWDLSQQHKPVRSGNRCLLLCFTMDINEHLNGLIGETMNKKSKLTSNKYHAAHNPFAFIHSHNINNTSGGGRGMVVPYLSLWEKWLRPHIWQKAYIPLYTIGAAYSGVSCLILTIFAIDHHPWTPITGCNNLNCIIPWQLKAPEKAAKPTLRLEHFITQCRWANSHQYLVSWGGGAETMWSSQLAGCRDAAVVEVQKETSRRRKREGVMKGMRDKRPTRGGWWQKEIEGRETVTIVVKCVCVCVYVWDIERQSMLCVWGGNV